MIAITPVARSQIDVERVWPVERIASAEPDPREDRTRRQVARRARRPDRRSPARPSARLDVYC